MTFSAVDRFRLKISSCRDFFGGFFFGLRCLYVFAILLKYSSVNGTPATLLADRLAAGAPFSFMVVGAAGEVSSVNGTPATLLADRLAAGAPFSFMAAGAAGEVS